MRLAAHPLALLLGAGATLLVGCGGGGGTKNGIPAASAGDLKSQITDVRQAVESKRCDEISGQLRQVDDGIAGLPSTVDPRLAESLREAGARLSSTATSECEREEETPTTTEPTDAPPPPSTPDTTTQTETQSTPQEPEPEPEEPEPEPEPAEPEPQTEPEPQPPPPGEPPAPAPAAPSGGATPEVQP